MLHRNLSAALVIALLAGITACATPPSDLDLTLQHASAQGRFMVRIEPPAAGAAINQMHAWQVHLATPLGRPVSRAAIGFDGGMPQHGHGFPTRPRITREISPGVYALEGMKFSMTGWWDMRFAIKTGELTDQAVFNVVVDERGIRR